jgi:hypothetical protein
MEGRRQEGCITGLRNTKIEETSWGQRRMEAPFEGGHGPEGAVAPYVNSMYVLRTGEWLVLQNEEIGLE